MTRKTSQPANTYRNLIRMIMSPLQASLVFTVQTASTFYIMLVLFRFIMQLAKADFRNPLAQFVVRATNPLIMPLRKVIPGFAKVDWATLLLAIMLQALALHLLLVIKGASVGLSLDSLSGLLIYSLGELLDLTLAFLFFATIIQVVYSWLQPGQYNPSITLLNQVTMPLYRPIHKVVPNIGMIDISPIVFIFLVNLARILLADPLIALGRSLI